MNLLEKCDFTLFMYRRLLETLQKAGYEFRIFDESNDSFRKKSVILRHDVDKLPQNALRLAEMEAEMGIRGSYHFRAIGQANAPDIIREIVSLGHEIAYHYEDINTVLQSESHQRNTDLEVIVNLAWGSFRSNLDYFRNFYPVRVISMHGSPGMRTDNRIIWKYFDYHECNIVCEPYFDIDHSNMLYLTDTGRRWDGGRFSIRDKASVVKEEQNFEEWTVNPIKGSLMRMTRRGTELITTNEVRSTSEIIERILSGVFPDKLIINTHPQRWTNAVICWISELIQQNVKNRFKQVMIISRESVVVNT